MKGVLKQLSWKVKFLHLKDAGRYWCKAEFTVRSTTCIVYPLAIHFTNDEDGNNPTIMTSLFSYFIPSPSPANPNIILQRS